MAAFTTFLTWVMVVVLLLLALLCCTPTSAAPGTGSAAEGGGSEEAGSSGEADQASHHTTSATHDPVVFPGRSSGRPHASHLTMASLPSYFPFWPPPARHHGLRRREPREEEVPAEDDLPSQQRFPRHFPLVQARHQRNNPWRQARQQGYMARGQPQPSPSLWYWD